MCADRPTTRRARGALAAALLVPLGLLAGAGCGGDDGDGGTTRVPCLAFEGSGTPAPETVVANAGTGASCDVAVVDLIVTDVGDLFGASFEVNYDPTRVILTAASATGSVLASDGAQVVVERGNTSSTGKVRVGAARVADTGVDVVGGQLLVRLTFVRVGTALSTSQLTFTSASLLDPSEPPAPIPGIPFSGGAFIITLN